MPARRRVGGPAGSTVPSAARRQLRRPAARRRRRSRRRPFDQPAARRVRRRCGRAAVHEPARLRRASLLRADPTGCAVSAHFLSAATAKCCSSCRATTAPGMPAPRRGRGAAHATTTRSASSSKASRARLRPAAVRRARRLARAHCAAATRSPGSPATSTWRPVARAIRAPGFDWRRLARQCAALRPALRADGLIPCSRYGRIAGRGRRAKCELIYGLIRYR